MIIISKAKVSESREIRKLEEKVWSEEVTNKYDMPILIRFCYVFVAKEKNKIVGAMIALPTKNNEVYVCDWIVDKKYRGLKIGQRLYERFLKETKGKTIVTLIDPKNIPSLSAHKELGFKVQGKIKDAYDLNDGPRIFLKKLN